MECRPVPVLLLFVGRWVDGLEDHCRCREGVRLRCQLRHRGASRWERYHPHYLTGEHKGFWSWTYREAGANLVREGAMTEARYVEVSEDMRAADDDPSTVVAHACMHQLVARKPEQLR